MTERVRIQAAAGDCRAVVCRPANNTGPLPAVIMFMDGLGFRRTLVDTAQAIADGGYVVLLPDLFYRLGTYAAVDPAQVFGSENGRTALEPLLASTDNRRAAEDTAHFIDYLDNRDDVRGTVVGTTGYCMGGAISLTAAGTYPDRVAAAASFHGGSLATDSEMSPHRLAESMTATVYIAAADNDRSYPPDMAGRLCEALMAASVDHRHDLYVGCHHGWTMADFPVYSPDAATRIFVVIAVPHGKTIMMNGHRTSKVCPGHLE